MAFKDLANPFFHLAQRSQYRFLMKAVSSWHEDRDPDLFPDERSQPGIPADITAQFGKSRQNFKPGFSIDPCDAPMAVIWPPVRKKLRHDTFDKIKSFFPDAEDIGMETVIVEIAAISMVTWDEIEGQSASGAGQNLVVLSHWKSGHRVPHK
ncbi:MULTISPECIES: hypothetical protein [unclassified Rhizobium]|uniref:hypothetical protein n=1 Tax=unclassified Rhizobium TaxID=2613769 RepID=UPI00071253A6|nr:MULTISPECIES: hypothetical protein [unclassified Rhizobium]KQS96360.1 hypothetical protein ASG50_04680 [Rhizobium sp. Leaf386]KQT06199.1 hypothetical protein ASG42_00925 [Rhizobium sp. Leaf391]KQU09566.1 hypothetical protein ASG68_00695 [Rhizobium sp. Leaf453]